MSLRLGLLRAGCRVLGKPRLRLAQDPVKQRKDFEWLGLVAGGRGAGLSDRVEAGSPPRRIVAPLPAPRPDPGSATPARGPDDAVVLFLHGGAYIAGSPRSHIGLIRALARGTGLRVVAPDYRLAPEAPFPAAHDDVRAAFDRLLAEGVAPGRVVLAGDSAGGGLALSLMAELGAERIRPAGCVAFCPWTDKTGSGAAMRENAARDPLLPAERLPDLLRFAAPGTDPADPRLSPLFARFADPPPCLIQYSETEILRDDALRMAEVLRRAGGRVTLQSWPDAPHCWQVLDAILPEARAAVAAASAFIRDLVGTARAEP